MTTRPGLPYSTILYSACISASKACQDAAAGPDMSGRPLVSHSGAEGGALFVFGSWLGPPGEGEGEDGEGEGGDGDGEGDCGEGDGGGGEGDGWGGGGEGEGKEGGGLDRQGVEHSQPWYLTKCGRR